MSGHLREKVEAEAHRLLRERLDRLRKAIEEAVTAAADPLPLQLSPGEWSAAGGATRMSVIRDVLDAVSRHDSQRALLSAILDGAGSVYPRCALFIAKGQSLSGWAGLGFLGDGGFRSEQVAKLSLRLGGRHLLARAVEGGAAVSEGGSGVGKELIDALGGVQPKEACAAPILVRGRPVAVLYGDTGDAAEGGGDAVTLEILARLAGLAMERLAATHQKPKAAEPQAPGKRAALPATIPQATPPEEAEMQAILADLGGNPRSASSDDGLSEEDRRRQTDARRFASLLVSELMLYNEAAVIQGRKHRDLYARLRKEIDRSRLAFQARFPSPPPGSEDFFAQELLRTLAQGDAGLLGN